MKELEEGDIILVEGSGIFINRRNLNIEESDGFYDLINLENFEFATKKVESQFNYTFITNVRYLKKSAEKGKLKDAIKVIEDSGSDVQYLGGGLYSVDRDSAKVQYLVGAGLIQLSQKITAKAKENQEKMATSRKKKIEKFNKHLEKEKKLDAERTPKMV